jgi:hypothetical protein
MVTSSPTVAGSLSMGTHGSSGIGVDGRAKLGNLGAQVMTSDVILFHLISSHRISSSHLISDLILSSLVSSHLIAQLSSSRLV